MIDRILHHHGAGMRRKAGYVYLVQGGHIARYPPECDAAAKKLSPTVFSGELFA
ncbi:hypothetical protein ACWXWB_14475 [Pantoea dispersa]|uniref:hypothetical protein n=1 Tax=Pantoea dispersa TaxID=59814 RepID=UPI002DB5A823|nr:hypothetical protein [Pantoea dispersa]MEB5973290.1 hypothetical protein [Pantoea dispersa]